MRLNATLGGTFAGNVSFGNNDSSENPFNFRITGTVVGMPGVPAGVAASDGTYPDRVRVSWNAVTGATGYDVYQDGSLAGSVVASPYDHTPGDTAVHTYTVRAKNGCGSSGASEADEGYAAGPPCSAAELVTASRPGRCGTTRGAIGG